MEKTARFHPTGGYKEIEQAFYGTLIAPRPRAMDDARQLNRTAAIESVKKLKKMLAETGENNAEYISGAFSRARTTRPMVDAIRLNNNGETVESWTPDENMPSYLQLVFKTLYETGEVPYVFFPSDTQVFFLDRDMEPVREKMSFERVAKCAYVPNGFLPEPVYTFYTEKSAQEMASAKLCVANMSFVGDNDLRKPIAVSPEHPARRKSVVLRCKENLNGGMDETDKLIVLGINLQTSPIAAFFEAYNNNLNKSGDGPSLALAYRRADRCDVHIRR